MLLGMISGYGRDAMATRGFEADSIYSIPNLKFWFVESTLYPFIGGDTVRRDTMKVAGLMPSVNIVLPYMVPPLKGCSEESLFELSACCVRNSRDILLALESEYRALFGRNLTLSRLSEAVILPLCPDKGDCINYDPNLAASVYLDNDLEMLQEAGCGVAIANAVPEILASADQRTSSNEEDGVAVWLKEHLADFQ